MKAAIVSPYFKTLGGGERYVLTFAEALLKKGWAVDVTLNDNEILFRAKEKFNLKLDGVNTIFFDEISKKYLKQRTYDLIFWVSDGSIPAMFGKKNLLHFQVPFHGVGGISVINKLKLLKIKKIVCNSFFTKKIVDKEYGVKGEVWYPPVEVEKFTSAKKKENIILAVGRFEKSLTEKRQDILIKTFKKMVKNGLKNWKLIIAGGCSTDESKNEILKDLKNRAKGLPVEIKANLPFLELKQLYAKSKIFWHAAGYGADEEKNPEKVEHFGMTTVEAMAAGCVPIAINKGGQKEIIDDGENGFLWGTIDDLIKLTSKVINDDKILNNFSASAIKKSRDFSKEKFYEKIYSFIG